METRYASGAARSRQRCNSLNDRQFADRKFFQLCHSSELLEPLWVEYVLTKADLDGPGERPAGFKQDKKPVKSAVDKDYVGSGFVRGHMAPAEDFSRSKTAIKSTFILSNVVPQCQGVNGGRWAQLELMVRNTGRRDQQPTTGADPHVQGGDDRAGRGEEDVRGNHAERGGRPRAGEHVCDDGAGGGGEDGLRLLRFAARGGTGADGDGEGDFRRIADEESDRAEEEGEARDKESLTLREDAHAAGAEVLGGLDDLLARVHDEGAVARDGLADRLARDQQEAERDRSRCW